MHVKIRLAKRFSRGARSCFFSSSYSWCDSVDVATVVGKKKTTEIRLGGGRGGVNGTLTDQYLKRRGQRKFRLRAERHPWLPEDDRSLDVPQIRFRWKLDGVQAATSLRSAAVQK